MNDNRKRPRIHRTDDKHDKALRAYAKEHGIEPWQALEIAIARLPWLDGPTMSALRAELVVSAGVAERDAAEIKKLRAAVTRAENVAIAREKQRDDAIADLRCAETFRADLESAREATRRADAALAEAKRTADKLRIEVERVTEEHVGTADRCRTAAQVLVAAIGATGPTAVEQVAKRAAAKIKTLESELAEVRATLATKGATDRLAERAETIAAALPDDFETKIAERAPGWKGTLPELRARVITLGFSRYDALATDAAKRAAERGR